MIKCQTIITALEQLAPRYLAEDWDNVGLLIGSGKQEIHKVLTCLDVTPQVVNKAIEMGADLIIAHHPLIFKGIKAINTDTQLGAMLQQLLKHDIAVYAAHTNLDVAPGGTNEMLVHLLNLQNVAPLAITKEETLVKLGVNVPVEAVEEVRQALGKAGAGVMDNYGNCSFTYQGTGYFTPLEGSNPFIGSLNKEEQVEEVRIETVLPEKSVNKVVKAMLKAHPYEVPAYDLYPTKNIAAAHGLGRIGSLAKAMDLTELLQILKDNLPTKTLRWVQGNNKPVQKIALCTGAGADFIAASKFQGADTYITGDVKYHEAQRAQELGINLIDAGHFGTEYPAAKLLRDYLMDVKIKEKWAVEIIADDFSQDIFNTFC